MKIILKIDHSEFLLPNDRGLTTILNALTTAKRCIDNRHSLKEEVVVEESTVDVSITVIRPSTKITTRKNIYREEDLEDQDEIDQ